MARVDLEEFEVGKIKIRRYKMYKYKISKEMLAVRDDKGRVMGFRTEKEMLHIINTTFGLNRVVTGLVIS